MGKQWKQCQTLFFGGSKITADGDCSHEIKIHLLLGRKVMTNLGSILKSRDITLPTKVRLVKWKWKWCHSVVSNSLRPHESQHARPPCPSPTPGVHSDSRPSSPWCHPAISSSVVPFSSCPQSLPASESFPMSQLFTWGGQSIIPSKEISGLISFRMDRLDLLAVQGTLKGLLQHNSSKPSILWCPGFFTVQLSYPYMTTGKTIALTRQTFVGKVMSLLFSYPFNNLSTVYTHL